jgi:hypothetical protein
MCHLCFKQTVKMYKLLIHYCSAHVKEQLKIHFGGEKNSCSACNKLFSHEAALPFQIYKTY